MKGSSVDLREGLAPSLATTRRRLDVNSYLTVWLVLLFVLDARQAVPGFGAIGSPAMLLVLPALFLWASAWVLPDSGLRRERQPIRTALIVYLAYQVFSFALAMTASLSETEYNGALRALLVSLAMVGIGLLVADGIGSTERLTSLLRRIVGAATFMSAFGIVQFFTGSALEFTAPGLEWNVEHTSIHSRSIFTRPSANTMHPIEFSVLAGGLLPLALHFALFDRTLRQRRHAAVASFIIALAIPLSVSRSGIVSAVLAMLIMWMAWKPRWKFNAAVTVCMAVPILWATIPGIVGTVLSMFTGTDDDVSIQARINRVPRIVAMFRERPLFGLGHGRWSVDEYFLIDNEVFVTALERGVIGLAIVLMIVLMGMGLALTVRLMTGVPEATRHLALAICASIAGLSISLITFDTFAYRILTGCIFLLIGAAGALWGLQHDAGRRVPLRENSATQE